MLNQLTSYLNSNQTPGQAGNMLWVLIYILVVFGGVSLFVMVMNWVERKALAHFQIRLGPMRVGPHGLLQPIADALKLFTKEDVMPEGADKAIFWSAPVWVVLTGFTTLIVVPFGMTHAVTDMNIGILYMLGISSLGVLGIIMAGWSSNSHYPLLGSLRSSAQMVSYEVAMGLAIVSAIVMTSFTGLGMYGAGTTPGVGTLSMIEIVKAQQAQHVWFVFKFFPLGFMAFGIFAVAMVAETNRAPFDLPEAESELVAGFHTEYSGLRWSLFMLAEYAGMVAVSSIATTLWLGGWLRPFPNLLPGSTWDLAFSFVPGLTILFVAAVTIRQALKMPQHPALRANKIGMLGLGLFIAFLGLVLFIPGVRVRVGDIFWFCLKVGFFIYLYIWYRATFPRYRFDQLMKVGWKVLLPLALGVLIVTGVVGLTPELTAWVKGLFA
ncbi:MAG TPA: complex I subunit 1 family protein [Terriglobales bacterium]|nr:complex I subunit 1 family protein [Terriglobales bacterium]